MKPPSAKLQKAPAFQYYPRDLLSSQKVAVMETVELGAHWLLVSHAWLSDPQGTLQNDDKLLARLARVPDEVWSNHRSAIMAPFVLNGDLWEHPRLLEELRKQRKWREKCRDGGIQSGKVRREEKLKRSLKGSSTTLDPKANSAVCGLQSSLSSADIIPLTPTSGGNSAKPIKQGSRANGTNARAMAQKEAKAKELERQQQQLDHLHNVPPENQVMTGEDFRRMKEAVFPSVAGKVET